MKYHNEGSQKSWCEQWEVRKQSNLNIKMIVLDCVRGECELWTHFLDQKVLSLKGEHNLVWACVHIGRMPQCLFWPNAIDHIWGPDVTQAWRALGVQEPKDPQTPRGFRLPLQFLYHFPSSHENALMISLNSPQQMGQFPKEYYIFPNILTRADSFPIDLHSLEMTLYWKPLILNFDSEP